MSTEQILLFDEDNYPIGSIEWRKYQYYRLLNSYSFDELDEYFDSLFKIAYDTSGRKVISFYDYCLIGVCIDIFHYDYYFYFISKYKKCRDTVPREKPSYL